VCPRFLFVDTNKCVHRVYPLGLFTHCTDGLNLTLTEKPLLSSIQMLTRRRFKSFSLSVPIALGLIFGTCSAPKCSGYCVLTHEAIIDAAWKESIVPVLLKRFPNATPEELLQAHAYAYGGAIIQDMGYYPFGNSFFSDLTHYVRTGSLFSR
jgi:hypothetical protein